MRYRTFTIFQKKNIKTFFTTAPPPPDTACTLQQEILVKLQRYNGKFGICKLIILFPSVQLIIHSLKQAAHLPEQVNNALSSMSTALKIKQKNITQ